MEIVESLNEHIRISLGSDACRFTGYEVLSSTPEDGGVRVRVRVSHASYRVPGPDVDRRRLAVLDFEIDEVHLYGAGGEREQRTGGGAAWRSTSISCATCRTASGRASSRCSRRAGGSRCSTAAPRNYTCRCAPPAPSLRYVPLTLSACCT